MAVLLATQAKRVLDALLEIVLRAFYQEVVKLNLRGVIVEGDSFSAIRWLQWSLEPCRYCGGGHGSRWACGSVHAKRGANSDDV